MLYNVACMAYMKLDYSILSRSYQIVAYIKVEVYNSWKLLLETFVWSFGLLVHVRHEIQA